MSGAERVDGASSFPPLGDVLEFLRLLWAIEHGLQKASRRMVASHGVTGPQRLVIRIVGRFPGISAGRLASLLHVDPSTLTGVLRRLERGGLLSRRSDPRDRRRAVLGLTAAGREVDLTAAGTVESAVQQALGELSPGTVRCTQHALRVLAASLGVQAGPEQGGRRHPAAGQGGHEAP
jgi:DNA-binding MarR family transcriptional regulator